RHPPSATPLPYTTLFRSLFHERLVLEQLDARHAQGFGEIRVFLAQTRSVCEAAGQPIPCRMRRIDDRVQRMERRAHPHSGRVEIDRKSTRLNSSHVKISY